MNEFNLSEKRFRMTNYLGVPFGEYSYFEEDVKEFIRLLKEELKTDLTGCFTSQKQCDEWNKDTNEIIDKLAGDKLVESKQ